MTTTYFYIMGSRYYLVTVSLISSKGILSTLVNRGYQFSKVIIVFSTIHVSEQHKAD